MMLAAAFWATVASAAPAEPAVSASTVAVSTASASTIEAKPRPKTAPKAKRG